MLESSILVNATGATITTSGTSANVALPNTSVGTVPRRVRVVATAAAYVRIGGASVAAVAGDTLIQPGDGQMMFVPAGSTKIAALQVSAAGVVQVSPHES